MSDDFEYTTEDAMARRHPGWPAWADPPYPELAPTRFDRMILRFIEWLRRRNEKGRS